MTFIFPWAMAGDVQRPVENTPTSYGVFLFNIEKSWLNEISHLRWWSVTQHTDLGISSEPDRSVSAHAALASLAAKRRPNICLVCKWERCGLASDSERRLIVMSDWHTSSTWKARDRAANTWRPCERHATGAWLLTCGERVALGASSHVKGNPNGQQLLQKFPST